jgi:hypothetical protein
MNKITGVETVFPGFVVAVLGIRRDCPMGADADKPERRFDVSLTTNPIRWIGAGVAFSRSVGHNFSADTANLSRRYYVSDRCSPSPLFRSWTAGRLCVTK